MVKRSMFGQSEHSHLPIYPLLDWSHQVPHAVRIRMDLIREITLEVALECLCEMADVPVIQFDQLVRLTQDSLCVFLRVAIKEDIVTALRIAVVIIVEIGMGTDLLLSPVAAHRPDAVILISSERTVIALFLGLFF
jgi:hypothetical protein